MSECPKCDGIGVVCDNCGGLEGPCYRTCDVCGKDFCATLGSGDSACYRVHKYGCAPKSAEAR